MRRSTSFCASFGLLPLQRITESRSFSLWQSLVWSPVGSFQCVCIWLLNLLLQMQCPCNALFWFFTIRWELSHFNTQCHVQVSPLTHPLSRSTSRFMSPISEARLNQAHSGVKESPSPHKHQGEPGCLDWVPNFLTAPSESISGFYMGQYSSSCPLHIYKGRDWWLRALQWLSESLSTPLNVDAVAVATPNYPCTVGGPNWSAQQSSRCGLLLSD